MSAPIISLYLMFSKGIIVNYERCTGPELSIIAGRNGLMKKGAFFKVNYNQRAYTTYEFETDYGFKAIGTSFAFYKVIGSKSTEYEWQKAPILEIKTFYSIAFILFIGLLFLSIYIFLIAKFYKYIIN